MCIRAYRKQDEDAVISLWFQCGLIRPWNDPVKDIRRKLKVQPHLFLVGLVDDCVVGSLMAGHDGHRGWINYLAVAPAHQHRGYGRLLMQHAEHLLQQSGCPKINVQIRTGNESVVKFYRSLNYELDDVVSMGKRLLDDN